MKRIEKLTAEHLAIYLPYQVEVYYEGVLNGKELGKWNRENKNLYVFEEPKTQRPEEILGFKIGLIKKIETYKNHSFLRVGNGHKVLGFWQFGDKAFLNLRTQQSITKEELELFSIEFQTQYESPLFDYNLIPYCDIVTMAKLHIDIFGLIESGLAVDKETIKKL